MVEEAMILDLDYIVAEHKQEIRKIILEKEEVIQEKDEVICEMTRKLREMGVSEMEIKAILK